MGLLKRLLGGTKTADDKQGEPPVAPHAAPELVEPAPTDEESGRWYVPTDSNKERFAGPDGLPALHLIPYRDSGGEDVLRLVEDSTGLLVGPTDRRLPPIGVYISQLRGEVYHESGCRFGDFSAGARVRLVREPENPHDPNAIAVYDASGKHLAAYVNKQKARTLSRLLDAGQPIEAISIRGTGPGRVARQVAILAARPEVLAHLMSPRPTHLPTPAHLR